MTAALINHCKVNTRHDQSHAERIQTDPGALWKHKARLITKGLTSAPLISAQQQQPVCTQAPGQKDVQIKGEADVSVDRETGSVNVLFTYSPFLKAQLMKVGPSGAPQHPSVFISSHSSYIMLLYISFTLEG